MKNSFKSVLSEHWMGNAFEKDLPTEQRSLTFPRQCRKSLKSRCSRHYCETTDNGRQAGCCSVLPVTAVQMVRVTHQKGKPVKCQRKGGKRVGRRPEFSEKDDSGVHQSKKHKLRGCSGSITDRRSLRCHRLVKDKGELSSDYLGITQV